MISIEQLEEGGLSARGPLHPPEPEAVPGRPDVLLVHQKFLEPETSSLAWGEQSLSLSPGETSWLPTHSGQLCGLEVGEAECRHLPELRSEGRQAGDDPGQLGQQDIEAVPEDDEVGVVPHIAGGGAQVDDGGGSGSRQAECVNMSHNVVPHLPLLLGRLLEVDVVDVLLHLRQLAGADLQAQLRLGFGQPEPELAPGRELLSVREIELHLLGGVAGVEWGLVTLCCHPAAPLSLSLEYEGGQYLVLHDGDKKIFLTGPDRARAEPDSNKPRSN